MNHELNARVAEEIMGWTNTRLVQAHQISATPVYIPLGDPPNNPPDEWPSKRIPDFSGSLDATHEMEEEIERQKWHHEYALQLWHNLNALSPVTLNDWQLLHATPEQRCGVALSVCKANKLEAVE